MSRYTRYLDGKQAQSGLCCPIEDLVAAPGPDKARRLSISGVCPGQLSDDIALGMSTYRNGQRFRRPGEGVASDTRHGVDWLISVAIGGYG